MIAVQLTHLVIMAPFHKWRCRYENRTISLFFGGGSRLVTFEDLVLLGSY